MNISFVIPVLNGEKYIGDCLESIQSEIEVGDEIVVVDNGSTDRTIEIVKNFKNINLYVHPDIPVSALRNRGALVCKNELLAFIDSDCVLSNGWRKHAITVFQDNTIHASGSLCDIPEDAGWIEKAWFAQKYASAGPVKYINTGNLLVRRPVFNKLNGFDETLVSDEDCEFGERLNNAGFVMVEAPEIHVIHLGNPETLAGFYKREKWHATSVLALQLKEIFNKPTVMSIIFGLTIVASLICVLLAIIINPYFILGALSILLIPMFTAIFRAMQFGIYKYIPHLTVLWGVFYIVRLMNMADHLFNHEKT